MVVPAYNEAQGVAETLGRLRARLPQSEIIVVDDASTDDTAASAEQVSGVNVLSHAYNLGYGGALKTGMAAAQGEYIAWFDADGEHSVDDLVAMVEQLHHGNYTAVIGQRQNQAPSLVRALGKWVIRMMARSLKFKAGPDINCGLRVFRREFILHYVYLLPDGFSASLTSLMILLERGYPVLFHPVTSGQRHGRSKVKLSDGFSTIMLVLRMIMLFAPLRIFLRLGGLLILIGIIYSLGIALATNRGIPVGGALVILLGVLFILLGLIADQISQMRLAQFGPSSELLLRTRPLAPTLRTWRKSSGEDDK